MDGVKVLDLGHGIPPAHSGRLMACFGAEVIKVEPLDGDPLRMSGPFPSDLPHTETSGLFQYLNVNKKGITLNLYSRRGRKLLMALLSWADIVVEGLGAGVMDDLGLTYEVMETVNPALVVVSITPFGQSGPYKDYKSYEIQPYAFGGPMYFTGQPEREPVNSANNVSDLHTGLAAASAGMVAFHRAESSGVGGLYRPCRSGGAAGQHRPPGCEAAGVLVYRCCRGSEPGPYGHWVGALSVQGWLREPAWWGVWF